MNEDGDRRVSRRAVLRSAALVGAGVGARGAAGRASGARTRPDFPEYVRDARGGTYADLRGESSVTIAVGAGGRNFAFVPALTWVDRGTTVTFEWVSDNHNVVRWTRPDGTDWQGTGSSNYDTGHTHSQTFETPGMYTYYCQPHDQLGMKGAIAVGPDVPTTEDPLEEEGDTVFGVPLPSTPVQWGVATVAVGGATVFGTAGAWLWWNSSTVDVDDFDDLARDTEDETDDAGGALTTMTEAERLDRHLRRAVEHRERAEAAFTDGEYERAREALGRAAAELDRAAELDAEGDVDAGERVAAEREVVASLRKRCERR